MNNRLTLILILLLGLAIGHVLTGSVQAYGEKDGAWTSDEKRQVIMLLEKIEQNTRGD